MSTKIRGKISSLIGKEFDSELFYGVSDNKYIKTKIKTYGYKVNTNFEGKKYQKEMRHINVCHW